MFECQGKKLLRTQNVFQDSPDEFYQPPDPIKPVPSKRQQRKKTAADDIKCNGKLKKVEDVASLAAYDFEEASSVHNCNSTISKFQDCTNMCTSELISCVFGETFHKDMLL